MSDYTEYAERLSERYSTLQRVGTLSEMETDYQPLYAQRGPFYAVKEFDRAKKAVEDARRRARAEQIREALEKRFHLDLLLTVPAGASVPIDELVGQESRVVLIGKPGAGKTTALRYLAAHPLSERDEELLTLVVDLEALAASEQSLPDYLSADAETEMGLELSPDFFHNVLWNGQAVVCLDGLDQIADQKDRARIVQQIESWIEDYARCRYIVTTRKAAYEPELSADVFAHYTLIPWSDAIVEELQSAWGEASAEWSEKEVQTQLASAPRLVRDLLAAQSMVAVLDEGDVDTVWSEIAPHLWDLSWQERIILVYRLVSERDDDAWVQLMTRLLDNEAGEAQAVVRRYLLLSGLALAASVDGSALDPDVRKRVVTELVDWVTDSEAPARPTAVDVLYELNREPLATEALLEVLSDQEVDAWSREAAALVLGHLASDADLDAVVEQLLARIDDAEEELMVRQASSTTLGHLAKELEQEGDARQKVMDALLERTRSGELLIGVRGAVAEAFAKAVEFGESYLDEVMALARGEGEERVPYSVRVAAGRALANMVGEASDQAFVDQVWELAQDAEVNEFVRVNLLESLGNKDASRAAEQLLAIAQNEKIYPPGHREALEAIGRLGYVDDDLVEALVTIAQTKDRKTKDFERLAAARTLGELGHLDLSLQYILMLIADKSIYRTTRNEALSMLGEVGLSGDEDLDNALIAVLQVWITEQNTTEDVRERAMKSLEMLGVVRDEIVRDLVGVVQDKRTYPRVRRAAVYALAELPLTDEHKEMVVESIAIPFYDQEEKSDLLRVPTAHLLYLWGEDEHGLEYLRLAAEQSYMALVRYRAGLVLHELGEEELAHETLLKLATDTSIADPIRCGAMRSLALWNIGDEALAQEFVSVAQEQESMPTVSEAAYDAIRSLLTA